MLSEKRDSSNNKPHPYAHAMMTTLPFFMNLERHENENTKTRNKKIEPQTETVRIFWPIARSDTFPEEACEGLELRGRNIASRSFCQELLAGRAIPFARSITVDVLVSCIKPWLRRNYPPYPYGKIFCLDFRTVLLPRCELCTKS